MFLLNQGFVKVAALQSVEKNGDKIQIKSVISLDILVPRVQVAMR